MKYRITLLALCTMVVMAITTTTPATALAQAEEYMISYDEGLVSFDYDQYPWGSLSGTYDAEGPIWNDDLTFPNGADSGCGGVMEVNAVNDTNNVLAMSAIQNADGTIDAAIVFVAYVGDPAPATFTVELGNMEAGFAWIDNASNLTFPEDEDFEAWFDAVEADGKFVGMGGTIIVTQVDVENFVGTFSGRMVDPNTFVMLEITAGVFNVVNNVVAATNEIATVLPAATISARPNPFNPQTTIYLEMPTAGYAEVQVFDLRGQSVRKLAAASFGAGVHSWVWDGANDQGLRQAGGLYFVKAQGHGWVVNQKVVYVP